MAIAELLLTAEEYGLLPDNEEDTQHGELEKYKQRGKHKGPVDPDTGEIVKGPVKGRSIDV